MGNPKLSMTLVCVLEKLRENEAADAHLDALLDWMLNLEDDGYLIAGACGGNSWPFMMQFKLACEGFFHRDFTKRVISALQQLAKKSDADAEKRKTLQNFLGRIAKSLSKVTNLES